VIAGEARGLRLKGPEGHGTRPMADRVKESLFGTLDSLGYPQAADRALDLYAGSGALGIEALSRGAAWCDFVEQNGGAARIITANLAFTRLAGRAAVHQLPVETFLKTRLPPRRAPESHAAGGDPVMCDIIFLDPPYAAPGIAATVAQLGGAAYLAPTGLLVVGHATAVDLPDTAGGLRRIRHKTFGGSAFSLYQRVEALDAAAAGVSDPAEPANAGEESR
jgi:16S rRNA (guanine(966)-N(2))-methyltransferase RsmD